ncbi:sulfide/dihydroorotate dehydrogenase-like FAD/NAD-binding protein [Oceanispirochaeta sp.]|jgi:ferredoxin--NADP+ reductase|uniref:sulfide/dihydroorotate dehydrogenase-like FAD/NAD-binding protein n=1 Tax=Oceanispirochaeta sp. TaxID=2035350 RepID=UPI002614DFBA|nr:sulfide/dihydroorotate dehydrogenase-like FAD/NAD-binding protein [Oceanispirochaeta sp.]MDA3956462.1 sulfide/dihydroorotate dehydrogenase-like FAD/NAD-binding protein [Oceanispirochaeta sp.]
MKKILEKKQLSADVFRMKIEAPLIAEERQAGQFLIIQIDQNYGERIPLTIANANAEEGFVEIIFQAVGATTQKLSRLNVGDFIENVLGPLGQPTHIEKKDGPVVCVGGGIGVAPMHPIVEAHHKAGNKVITIMGARNKELLIMEDEMRALSDELIICTDDGSYGRKDLVTVPLKELCESENPPSEVFAIGPPIMMKFCAETTRPFAVPTMVSLNTIMVDGTGMCGGCRVSIGNETKFVCVDGPEFDGHLVDFDNMMLRQKAYKKHEAHRCNLDVEAEKLEAKQK